MRIFLLMSLGTALAGATEHSTLILLTDPDSAQVSFDGSPSPEAEFTPYRNSGMLPGDHTVMLRSRNASHLPVTRQFQLEPERELRLVETFERRTLNGRSESLSSSPWKMETGAIWSSPSRMSLLLRLGLPAGFETHFLLPPGRHDLRAGLSWTLPRHNTGIDLSWIASDGDLPAAADGAGPQVTVIAEHAEKRLDLLGHLAYRRLLRHPDSANLLQAELRAGLISGRALPYLKISARHRCKRPGDGDLQFRLAPGFLWQSPSPGAGLECSVPITARTPDLRPSPGLEASISFRFGIHSPAVPQLPVSVEPAPAARTPLLFGAHEITNAEYLRFCAATGRARANGIDPPDSLLPAVNVSLNDARAYAEWAGARLPTVSEWQRLLSGSAPGDDDPACGTERPEAVTSRTQNGLHHLIGNVAEWLEPDTPAPGRAFAGGGSFRQTPGQCREAMRHPEPVSPGASPHIGFRLVSELR